MRHIPLLSSLIVAGCAVLPVHAPDTGHADREVIDLAAADLGLRTEYVDDAIGAVEVEIWEGRRNGDLGHGQMLPCGGEAGFVLDSAVARQEIGHALGLPHVDDPGNVMSDTSVGDDQTLTSKQKRALRRAVAWLHACGRAAR